MNFDKESFELDVPGSWDNLGRRGALHPLRVEVWARMDKLWEGMTRRWTAIIM